MINPFVVYDAVAEVVGVSREFVSVSSNDIMITPNQAILIAEKIMFNSGMSIDTYDRDVRKMILSAVLKSLREDESKYSNSSRKERCAIPRAYAAIIMSENYNYSPKEICDFFGKGLNFFYRTVRKYMDVVEEEIGHRMRFNMSKRFVLDNVKYHK